MREPNEYPSASFRMIAVVALLVGVGAGVFAFFSFVLPSLSDGGKTVYIQADSSPIKTPPDQPGGMAIPHQDKLVFNSVASQGAKQNPPERLAPPPEEPVYGSGSASPAIQSGSGAAGQENLTQLPAGRTNSPGAKSVMTNNVPAALGRAIQPGEGAAPAATATEIKPSEITSFDPDKMDGKGKKVKTAANENEEVVQEGGSLVIEYPGMKRSGGTSAVTQEEPAASVMAEATAPPMAITPRITAEEAAADEAALLAAEEVKEKEFPTEQQTAGYMGGQAPAAASGGSARFQLASFTDRESAEAAVQNMQSKFANALEGATLQVTSATVKGKQVFRVQGNASSKEEMENVCLRVKASGGACVPAR